MLLFDYDYVTILLHYVVAGIALWQPPINAFSRQLLAKQLLPSQVLLHCLKVVLFLYFRHHQLAIHFIQQFHKMASSKNLLVIGPGQLGARVATLWKERFPEAKIALKANKEDQKREAKWQSLGFVPYVEDAGEKYPYVLFAAPRTKISNFMLPP